MATDTATDDTTTGTATITTIPVTVTSTNPAPPAPVKALSTNNGTEYIVRFPPYPPIPDGVKIIPFTESKERGIRIQPGGEDNETEIDGCGVPTIPLTSAHTTDWCKTETKRARAGKGGPTRRKKKRKTGGGISGPSQRDWIEYWEDREAAYRIQGTYDPHLDAYERFCQGAWDFKSGRQWPLAEKQSGPLFVWGEFLRFAGIPALVGSVGNAAQAVEVANDKKEKAADDSDSDLEDNVDDDETMAGILNPQNLTSMDAVMKAQAKGEAFLKDPALMLKVFLSSYARDRGIIWTDLNLTGAPTLMRFFLDFLVVNRVLPKREENAIKHESTRRVIDLALKELPLTSKLARVWPDEFHKACKGQWGSKAEVFVFRSDSPMGGVIAPPEQTTEEVEEGWGGAGNAEQGDDGWGTGGWGEDTPEGWGDPHNSSAWDSEVVAISAGDEDDAMSEIRVVDVDDDGEVTVATPGAIAEEEDNWNTFRAPSIFDFLGPTTLPLTHTTGIVESSVRRIKAVLPPSTDTSKFPIAKDASPEAVEGHMKRTFGVVIFEPWVNWNKGEEPHLAIPKILESSCGTVITENVTGTGEATTSTDAPVPGALPPFDPHKDEISVLVDPSYLDLFSVGMGCLCTWVQMARVTDFEPQDPKKKKKKNVKMERFWYVDEALRVVPSYYTYLG